MQTEHELSEDLIHNDTRALPYPTFIDSRTEDSSTSRSVRQGRVIREQSILPDALSWRHWRCMKQKTYTVKLTTINITMFRMSPSDRINNNQRIECQPEDIQLSTAGDWYVPSLGALYLGPVLQHENRKKTKQVCNDIALPALSYLPNERCKMSATRLATLCRTFWKANKLRIINKHKLWSR